MISRSEPRQHSHVATIGRRLPFSDYAALKAVNWSTLKAGLISMLHYKHGLDEPDEDTEALALGRAAHCAVFEPERYALDFIVDDGSPMPDLNRSTKIGKAFELGWLSAVPGRVKIADADQYRRAVFVSQHPGKTLLTREQHDRAWQIGEHLRRNRHAARYLASGRPEQTIEWVDPETKLPCKARLDWLCEPLTDCDLKTARTIRYSLFSADAWRRGYFHQLAFHRMGLEVLSGRVPALRILAIESAPPFDCAVFEPDPEAIEHAANEVRSLLLQLSHSRRVDEWRGQYQEEEVLRAPFWAMKDGVDTEDDATPDGPITY